MPAQVGDDDEGHADDDDGARPGDDHVDDHIGDGDGARRGDHDDDHVDDGDDDYDDDAWKPTSTEVEFGLLDPRQRMVKCPQNENDDFSGNTLVKNKRLSFSN